MVRFYCDRCKKQMPEPISVHMLADKMAVGDMGVQVYKIVSCGDASDEHIADSMDICLKCRQELNMLVKDFMKKECAKK